MGLGNIWKDDAVLTRNREMWESALTVDVKVTGKIGMNNTDITQTSILDQFSHLESGGLETGPHGLHQEDVLLLRQSDERTKLCRIRRERLLTQDVFSSVKCEDGSRIVECVRGTYGC